jgi:flagellar hook-length control protein FliK
MQSHEASSSVSRVADARQAFTQRLMAMGGGTGTADFLSLLMQTDGGPPEPKLEEPKREREPRSEAKDHDTRPKAKPETPESHGETAAAQARSTDLPAGGKTASETAGQRAADAAEAAAEPKRPAEAAQQAPKDAANPRQDVKVSVEQAGLESRPRATLTAGASQVAMAAHEQAQAQAGNEARNGQAAAGQAGKPGATAEQASQRPDFSQLARDAMRGQGSAEATGNAATGNTTKAGLDAMAQKAAQQQTGGAQQPGVQPAAQTQGQEIKMPGQQAAVQAAQQPAQAAEVAKASPRLAQQTGQVGKPQSFVQSLSSTDALAGTPGGAPGSGKTDTLAAAKQPSANASSQKPAAEQVAVQIQKAAAAGKDRIQIKLNPAELGRVDVKLEFQNDGSVRATVSVERPETFDMLQRDARGLERALADAGFKNGQASLSFEMQTGGQHGNGSFGSQLSDSGGNGGQRAGTATGGEPTPEPQAQAAAEASVAADGSVDIRI